VWVKQHGEWWGKHQDFISRFSQGQKPAVSSHSVLPYEHLDGDHSRHYLPQGFLMDFWTLKRTRCTNFPSPLFYVLSSSFPPLWKPTINPCWFSCHFPWWLAHSESWETFCLMKSWMGDCSIVSVADGNLMPCWALKRGHLHIFPSPLFLLT
jgi:hypothetical protein